MQGFHQHVSPQLPQPTSLKQIVLADVAGQVNIAGNLELFGNACTVGGYGLFAQAHLSRNLLEGLSRGHMPQNLKFATGKCFVEWADFSSANNCREVLCE